MNNIEVNHSCNVIGHLQVKELTYTTKKCSLCNKRCLFRINKMVKCIVCKCVMHKRCLMAANNRPVHTPSCSIAIDQRFSEDNSALATLHQSRQTVAGAPNNETQEVDDCGIDVVLKIEVRWLWNKGTSAVLWLKVELKLRKEYYVSEVMIHVRKELWDQVLDIIHEENTNIRSRSGGGGGGDRVN